MDEPQADEDGELAELDDVEDIEDVAEVDDPAEGEAETPEQAAAAMWRARRRHRFEEVDRLDALYKVYVTAILGTVVVLLASSAIGDTDVSASGLAKVRADGAGWLGLAAAVVIAIGLRSGSRGGPLALEPAEVRTVLLSPADRRTVLARHARRQLRFAAFLGAVVGAVAGQLAVRRLTGAPLGWVAAGAAFGALVGLAGVGTAMVASGHRLPRPAATAASGALVLWAAADPVQGIWSPFRLVGELALWPLDVHVEDLAAAVAVLAVTAWGLASLGGTSLELAERRTGLVAQLRFAVTVQDLRTVVLLRRQLAMDLPRDRPWIRLRRPARWFPVWRRDLRGLVRFPLGRVGRLVLLGVIAGLCVRGVFDGTTPLLIPAGLALYVAALDAVEPLAQEADQLDRADSFPIDRGDLLLRHLGAPTLVMVCVALVGWAAVAVTAPDALTAEIGAVLLLPAAFMATASGVVSVVMAIPSESAAAPIDSQVLMPEMAGIRVVMRTFFPPALAVLGVTPVIAARQSLADGFSPSGGAASVAVLLIIPVALTVAWVRFREPAKLWWRASLQQSQQPRTPTKAAP